MPAVGEIDVGLVVRRSGRTASSRKGRNAICGPSSCNSRVARGARIAEPPAEPDVEQRQQQRRRSARSDSPCSDSPPRRRSRARCRARSRAVLVAVVAALRDSRDRRAAMQRRGREGRGLALLPGELFRRRTRLSAMFTTWNGCHRAGFEAASSSIAHVVASVEAGERIRARDPNWRRRDSRGSAGCDRGRDSRSG